MLIEALDWLGHSGFRLRAGRSLVYIDPYRVSPDSPKAAKVQGVATVHQSIADAVVPALSVADNLLLDELCGSGAKWWTPRASMLRLAICMTPM